MIKNWIQGLRVMKKFIIKCILNEDHVLIPKHKSARTAISISDYRVTVRSNNIHTDLYLNIYTICKIQFINYSIYINIYHLYKSITLIMVSK